MDISVIKEQLGNFKTFVNAVQGLLVNLPESLRHLGGLFTGEIKLFDDSHEYSESIRHWNAELAEAAAKAKESH